MNNHTEELLPSAEQFTREAHGSADSLTGIYSFDGENTRWEIPVNVIPQDHYLGKNFTISFWMRHDKLTGDKKHKKEQILCNSDGDGRIIYFDTVLKINLDFIKSHLNPIYNNIIKYIKNLINFSM